MIKFEIPGEPVPKARPRLSRYGVYTPKRTSDYEYLVKQSFLSSTNMGPLTGPLFVYMELYYKIPKSAKKADRIAMEQRIIRPTKRPDVDNCVKSILDALNEVAYKDDSQVVDVFCRKFYANEPKSVITLMQIDELTSDKISCTIISED
jgi:Holliday junction resolvase RusA-like endonuclease